MASVKKYAQSIIITPGYTCGGDDMRYKCWGDLDKLKAENGVANCHGSDNLIAGRNGTYRQPAPLTFGSFGFSLAETVSVTKVVLHYKTQKFINNGYYPDIGGATIKLLGTSQAAKTGRAVSETKTEDTITWTGVTQAQVNSSNFGVQIAFPENASTTPGYIILENVYLEVFYEDNGVKLTLNSEFNKNPVVRGETFEAVFTVNKTSTEEYTAKITIDLPLGVTVEETLLSDNSTVKVVNQSTGKTSYQQIIWTTTMGMGNVTPELGAILKAGAPSSTFSEKDRAKQCIMTETDTKVSYTNYLTVNEIAVSLSTTFYAKKITLIEGKQYQYTVKIHTNDPLQTDKVLWMNIPTECEVDMENDLITTNANIISAGYSETYKRWYIKFRDHNEFIGLPFIVTFLEPGPQKLNFYVNQSGKSTHLADLSLDFLVSESDLGELAFTRVLIPETYTQNMGDGIEYYMGSQVKITQSTTKYAVTDHGDNLRIGVYNAEGDPQDEEHFVKNIEWADTIATTTSKEMKVKFKFNEQYPLYFVYSHEHTGDWINPYVTLNFSEPWLVERDYYNSTPIRDLRIHPVPALTGSTRFATGTFAKNIEKSVLMNCYQWNDGGIFKENIAPLGIEILFDYVVSEPTYITVELYLAWNMRGQRDIILDTGSGTASAGSIYDLFGFKPGDFMGKLSNMQVKLQVFNQDESTGKVQLDNVRMNLKYIKVIECGYGFSLDGERSQWYGMIVSNIEHKRGTQHERTLYHVTGTDTTIINRSNIEPKEISIEFFVPDCDLKEAMYLTDRIIEWMTNKREPHSNKPIPKELVLDYMQDRYYPVVRIKEFDDEIVGNSYKAKVELEVPDGTSFAVQETVTGAHGTTSSSITVKPIIVYKAITENKLTVKEEQLGQELVVSSSKIKKGTLITIDADNRTVRLSDGTDISTGIDYNSQWFRIRGEYAFTSTTGNIQSVSYRIRRG